MFQQKKQKNRINLQRCPVVGIESYWYGVYLATEAVITTTSSGSHLAVTKLLVTTPATSIPMTSQRLQQAPMTTNQMRWQLATEW